MHGHHLLERVAQQRLQLVCGLHVRQVARIRAHAPLHRIRVGPVFEHLHIVVALQCEDAHIAQRLVGLAGDDTRVGHEPYRVSVGLDPEPARRCRVVRRAEGVHLHARQRQRVARGERP